MSVPQTYGASLYDLAKDEGMSREILLELEGIVSLFNEHPAYVKILDAPQIERELNLTLEEIGNAVGVSKSTVKKWENGFISNMKRDKISALAKILNINPVTLITGEYPTTLPEGAVPYNPVMHRIPILGDIAAGLPIFSEENYEGYTYTELNHGGKYFALKVKGDSMTAANIPDGSLVTVRVQPTVENGEIAAVRINHDSFTIKRFKREKNIVMLMPQSYNPEHQTQIYDLKQDSVEIVGKVVECRVGF